MDTGDVIHVLTGAVVQNADGDGMIAAPADRHQLLISESGADLQIVHDGGIILLTGQAGLALTAADFEFL